MFINKHLTKIISFLLIIIIIVIAPGTAIAEEDNNNFWDSLSNGIDEALDWSQNAVSDVVNWTGTAIEDAQVWTQQAADDAAAWTDKAAVNAWNWTQTAASDTQDWITGAADDTWNWTQGAANDAWNWTQKAANNTAEWTCTTATNTWDVVTKTIGGTWTDIFGNNPSKGPYNIRISSPLFESSDFIGSWNNSQDVYTECFSYDDSYDISLIISKRPEDVIPPSVGEMNYSDLVAEQFDTVTFASDVADGAGVRAMAQELRFKAVDGETPVYGRALGIWTDHYIISFVITADILLDDDGTELSDLPEIDEIYDLWLDTLQVYETNEGEDDVEAKEDNINLGTLTTGAVRSANRIYNEVRFHSPKGGHGFAAEQANTLYDNIKGIFNGQKSKVIGDNNKYNGADRLLTLMDGTPYQIQTKYHKTAKASIDACFDSEGKFRYLYKGLPMKIEVPSDQYDDAVCYMKEHIENGDIPGISDAEQATEIVRKGNITYKQAKNIAKAGNIDSIKYDAVNGCVDFAYSFGISAAVEFAVGLWNGEDIETALSQSALTGLQVGGTSFVISVLAGQISKSAVEDMLVGTSEKIANLMGTKAAAAYVSAFRTGGEFSTSAITNSAAKLLRGHIIVTTVSLIVLSIPDIVDTCSGRMSGKQLLKNVAETGAGIIGGLGGWFGGATLGTAIFPGVGTVIGGIIGSVAGGFIMQIATGAVTDLIVEDDAEEMLDIISDEFKTLAEEYLLNEAEIEETMEYLNTDITGDTLKDMFACSSRELYASEVILRPEIIKVINKRSSIEIPDTDTYQKSVITALESLYDEENPEGAVTE